MELTLDNVVKLKWAELELDGNGDYEIIQFDASSFMDCLLDGARYQFSTIGAIEISKEQCINMVNFEDVEILERLFNASDLFTEANKIVREHLPMVLNVAIAELKSIIVKNDWDWN